MPGGPKSIRHSRSISLEVDGCGWGWGWVLMGVRGGKRGGGVGMAEAVAMGRSQGWL